MSDEQPPVNEGVEAPQVSEPVAAPQPVVGVKPKIAVGFFLLGFFSPILLSILFGALMWAGDSVAGGVVAAVGGILQSTVIPLTLGVGLALYIKGNRSGDTRLRSVGLGALWALVVYGLLMLLLFGTCLVALGTGSWN